MSDDYIFDDYIFELDSAADPLFAFPTSARVHNYLSGGKDHFAADRAVARTLLDLDPRCRQIARASRQFLSFAVFGSVGLGISQYIDLGSGLPPCPCCTTRDFAMTMDRNARVAYVDNDPLVCSHTRALFDYPNCALLEADFTKPSEMLLDPPFAETIDLEKPTAVMLLAVLNLFSDPSRILSDIVALLAPGSMIAISHLAPIGTITGRAAADPLGVWIGHVRTRQELSSIIGDANLLLLEPGIVPVTTLCGRLPPSHPDSLPLWTAIAMVR